MNNSIHAQELYETTQALFTRIQQASWVDKNKPHVQWPWVVGYLENLIKNLPLTKDNMEYLKSEFNYIDNFVKNS